MSQRSPAVCDRCGRPIQQPGDAVVRLRFDREDALAEAGVDHRGCADRQPPSGERVELLNVSEFLLGGRARSLAAVARLRPGASASRVVRKAERVARGAAG